MSTRGSRFPALMSRRKSILDLISAEARSIKGTLGRVEASKLDQPLDSIRQLESKERSK